MIELLQESPSKPSPEHYLGNQSKQIRTLTSFIQISVETKITFALLCVMVMVLMAIMLQAM